MTPLVVTAALLAGAVQAPPARPCVCRLNAVNCRADADRELGR